MSVDVWVSPSGLRIFNLWPENHLLGFQAPCLPRKLRSVGREEQERGDPQRGLETQSWSSVQQATLMLGLPRRVWF